MEEISIDKGVLIKLSEVAELKDTTANDLLKEMLERQELYADTQYYDKVKEIMPYVREDGLLRHDEWVFWEKLSEAFKNDTYIEYICPKPTLREMISVNQDALKNDRDLEQVAYNLLKYKNIDYLFCGKHLTPRWALELDGGSHNNDNAKERDDFKNCLFENIGIPLVRITTNEANTYATQKLRTTIYDRAKLCGWEAPEWLNDKF